MSNSQNVKYTLEILSEKWRIFYKLVNSELTKIMKVKLLDKNGCIV